MQRDIQTQLWLKRIRESNSPKCVVAMLFFVLVIDLKRGWATRVMHPLIANREESRADIFSLGHSRPCVCDIVLVWGNIAKLCLDEKHVENLPLLQPDHDSVVADGSEYMQINFLGDKSGKQPVVANLCTWHRFHSE